MNQTQITKIVIAMRAKLKTGISSYAINLPERLPALCPDFEVIPWKTSFFSYQDKRISPLNDSALLFQQGDNKDFLDKLDLMLHSEETRRKYTALGADKVKQMTWDHLVYAATRIIRL